MGEGTAQSDVSARSDVPLTPAAGVIEMFVVKMQGLQVFERMSPGSSRETQTFRSLSYYAGDRSVLLSQQ